MLITRTLNSFENKPVLFNLKNLEFYTEDCSLDKIVNYALNGHIFTYNFKDSFFVRKDHYMSENYLSTQFIIVDVDHSCFNAEEIMKTSITSTSALRNLSVAKTISELLITW